MTGPNPRASAGVPRVEPGGAAALPEPIASAYRRIPALTPRERAVFHRLGAGQDNRAIARDLNISERTVKRYVTAIFAKLGLRSRLQAGLCALLLSWTRAEHASVAGFEHLEGPDEPATEAFDALAALRAAGNRIDVLTAQQRAVLAQLTEDEVAVLNSIKRRLDAVSATEAEGHDHIEIRSA